MKRHPSLITASLMLAALAPLQTRAAVNTWNNGAANFIWNLSSANWTSPTIWADGNDAIFGATGAGTVTLGVPISVHNQTFNAAGYIIAGGANTLTLAGTTPTITVNAAVTNAAGLYGTQGLTVQGTGVLTLADDPAALDGNHYTGGTRVKSGTVILGIQNDLSGSSYAVDSIEALDTGATVSFETLFDGVNYNSSPVNQIAASATAFASHLHMTGGTLDLNNDPKNQSVPVPEGTGLIVNTGTSVQAGLNIVADGLNHTFSGVIADGGPLIGDNSGQGPGNQIGIVGISGQVNGGGGEWTLTGANTYSGSTRLQFGSIKLAGAGTLGVPTLNNLTGPLRIYGPSYLDLNGTSQTICLMTHGSASAQIYNSAVGTVSTLTFGYGNEQALNRDATWPFIDNLGTGGILALKKVATGPAYIDPNTGLPAFNCVQTLSGVNTYSGDTTVAGGKLILSAASAVSPNSAFRLSTLASLPSPDTSVSLALTYSGTANVRQLWINGVQQPNGVYGAGTPGIDPASTGTITVTGYAPVALGFSHSGSSLTFSWQGVYKLQSKTNNLIGAWFDYPGGGTSPVNATVDHAKGAVFFRLSS